MSFRLAALVVAILGVGVGISLMVSAHLGVSPADAMTTGGAERLGIGVGTFGWISGAVITTIAWLMGRTPQWGTLWGTFLVGAAVNVCLTFMPEPDAMVWRVPMCAVGLAVLYVSIAVGVATTLGTGPIELLMLALSDRGVSVQVARWGIEAVVLVIGVILGGQIGVGTLIFVVLTGPVLARLMPSAERFMGTSVIARPIGFDA
ncbi:MAG: hypothetical protein RIS41_679 [Actinomycetota bacterium]